MSALADAWTAAWDLAPRALAGGLLAAAACGAAGVLLRWRRLVWAGLAVPQAATAGTACALGAPTMLAAIGLPDSWAPDGVLVPTIVATVLAVLWLVPVSRGASRGGERAAAACFLLAATLTVLFVSQSPHGTHEVEGLATGATLLFLGRDDVSLLAVAMPIALFLAFVGARTVAHLAFDRDHARAGGHPVVAIELAFAAGLAALVSLVVPRVGAPFVFACLTVPPAAAERMVARPRALVAASALLGAAGFLVGAIAGVHWDLPFSTAAVAGVLAVGGGAALVSSVVRTVSRRA